MVSAVFHTPFDPATRHAVNPLPVDAAPPAAAPGAPRRSWRERLDGRAIALAVIPPLAGIGLLLGIWALCTLRSTSFPSPLETWDSARALFADPFYRKSPNDQGIGWNILASLGRVGLGFGLA